MQVNATPLGSFPASAALASCLRVKRDVTHGLVVAGAEDRELGTLQQRHIVSGLGTSENAAVVLPNAPGTIKMVAAGAIDQWADVYGAAAGKIDNVINGNRIGIALVAATADGDQIEVLRQPGERTRAVEAHTAADTLTAAESGSVHTTVGATGTVIFTLLAAVVGLEFFFRVGAAQELRIDPDGTETIALPSTGVQGAGGKYLTANADGESVHLVCDKAGEWTVYGYTGTWTAEG